MEITEVRIKLTAEAGDRLQAFCSITLDHAFVVRDLKIIEGTNGPFVAMPSRKLTGRCLQCGCKNHLRAAYCNQCGVRLREDRIARDESGRSKLYADIAHPINSACREMIQERIIEEFRAELDRAKQPGYVSRYEEFDLDEDFERPATTAAESNGSQARDGETVVVDGHTKIEPAQRPHGPHRRSTFAPANSAAAEIHQQHPPAREDRDTFGAGIL